jgi:hypothetical protein
LLVNPSELFCEERTEGINAEDDENKTAKNG